MKPISVLIFFFLTVPSFSQTMPTADLRQWKAIVTSRNDISLEQHPGGKLVNIPAVIKRVIDSLAKAAYKWRLRQEKKSGQSFGISLKMFYGPVFRITAPGNRFLFVFRQNDLFGASFFVLILFDPKTGNATADPPEIWGRWMDNGDWGDDLVKPIVYFDTLGLVGSPELVMQERVHNGSMYNAVVYHYFMIDSDLALRHSLAIETRLIDIRNDTLPGLIVRKLKRISSDSLEIKVFLQIAGRPDKRLGEVIITRSPLHLEFTVKNRKVIDRCYRKVLVTGSEEADNEFLSKGYTFRY